MRQPIVVLLGGLDLPTHDQKHDEDNGHLLRLAADVWKGPQDIGEDLRQWMCLNLALRVDERSEVRIQWSNECSDRDTLRSTRLSFLQEVEEDDIERACWLSIPRQRQMRYKTGSILCKAAAADIAGRRLLWWWKVWVYRPPLTIVKQKVYTKPLVKRHVWCLDLRRACWLKLRAAVRVPAHVAGGAVAMIQPWPPALGHAGRVHAVLGRVGGHVLQCRVELAWVGGWSRRIAVLGWRNRAFGGCCQFCRGQSFS